MGDIEHYRHEESEVPLDKRPWSVPDSIFDELRGRRIEVPPDYDDGMPPQLFRDFNSRGFHF